MSKTKTSHKLFSLVSCFVFLLFHSIVYSSINEKFNYGIFIPDNSISLSIESSTVCLGESTKVILSSSEVGVDYQLYCDEISVDIPIPGTGAQLEIVATPSKSCDYQVVATNTSTLESIILSQTVHVDVIVKPTDNIAVSISEPQICIGENTIISLDSSESGISYQLHDGTNMHGEPITGNGGSVAFPEFSPFRSLIYHIIATNNRCGSTANLKQTAKVLVGLPPEDHLHPTINKHSVCQGEEVIVSLTPTNPNVNYQLFDGDIPIGDALPGNSEVLDFQATIPNKTTTYRIEALGDKCVYPIDIRYTVSVDVHHPPSTDKQLLADRNLLCSGEEVRFSIENSENDIFYRLHDGTNFIEPSIVGNGETVAFPSFAPSKSNTYHVYSYGSICSEMVLLNTNKQVDIIPISQLSVESLTTPEEVCLGEKVDIELPYSVPGVDYILMDGTIELESILGTGEAIVFEDIIPNQQSSYKISIGNCAEELIGSKPPITVHPSPSLQILTKDVSYGSDGQITLSVSDGTPPYTYIINSEDDLTLDENFLEMNNLATGSYKILVIDANFCRTSETGKMIEINLTDGKSVIVTNAITPNGDGINDKWLIQSNMNAGLPEVTIFNIYGQKIYHSKSYNNDWNGSYNGVTLPNGAYYYLIEYHSKEIQPIKGTVAILGNY